MASEEEKEKDKDLAEEDEEKDKDLAEEDTSSPQASTSQEIPEDVNPPILQDTSHTEGCANWCRHCFCFSCVQEWACRDDVCPNCQQSVRHQFPMLGPHGHQEQDIVPGGRPQGRSAERRRRHSSGSQRHSSSSRAHDGVKAGASRRGPRRGQSRSQSWHQDGHSRAEHGQGYNSSRGGRWQRSRSQDSGGSESRSLRQERDVPISSWRSQRAGGDTFRDHHATRRQFQWRSQAGREYSQGHRNRLRWWDRDEEHPRAWDRRWRRSPRRGYGGHRGDVGTAAHGSFAGWRWWRRRNRGSRPPRDIQDFRWRSRSTRGRARMRREWQRRRNWDQRRGPRRQQDIGDYSRRSRQSYRTRSRARPWQERQRRRDRGQGQAPASRWGVAAYSRRRERRRWGGHHSSRQGRAERRRSRRRTW